MVFSRNRCKIPPVVAVAPCALPDCAIVRRHHAAFPAGCHDLVLTKRKSVGVSDRTHGPSAIRGTLRLRAVFDDLKATLTRQLHNRIHSARPARKMDYD